MKVLFIYKGNIVRSQMAAAVYNHLTGTKDAVSAGTYVGAPDEPEGRILSDLFPDPAFFEILEEHGMNMRNERTLRVTPEMIDTSDIVVSMAEEPYIPDFIKNDPKIIVWDVENFAFVNRKEAKRLFLQLNDLVQKLIQHNKTTA
jgi:protein-tyrosine-phosphatase